MVKSARKPLTREERPVWADAFGRTYSVILARDGQTLQRSLPAIVRSASEAAWASIDEYRRAVKGIRP